MKKEIENALDVILEELTESNDHTLALMLEWAFRGCKDVEKDDLMYRTRLVAQQFLYSGDIRVLGRK